jgi:hypothetical protein
LCGVLDLGQIAPDPNSYLGGEIMSGAWAEGNNLHLMKPAESIIPTVLDVYDTDYDDLTNFDTYSIASYPTDSWSFFGRPPGIQNPSFSVLTGLVDIMWPRADALYTGSPVEHPLFGYNTMPGKGNYGLLGKGSVSAQNVYGGFASVTGGGNGYAYLRNNFRMMRFAVPQLVGEL